LRGSVGDDFEWTLVWLVLAVMVGYVMLAAALA
jgi:hypothetical protein